MSVGAYHDVRTCYIESVPHEITYRFIQFAYNCGVNREVMFDYVQRAASVRNMIVCQNTQIDERRVLVATSVYRYQNSRISYTPPAEVNFEIRYCTYALGSSLILYTMPTVLAITYSSNRKAFVEKAIVSNRLVELHYTVASDKLTVCCVREATYMYTPEAVVGTKSIDERKATYVIGSSSQRYIRLKYTTESERTMIAVPYYQINVYAPPVDTIIIDIATERHCTVGQGESHSERWCWILTSRMSERHIFTQYTTASERKVVFYIGRINKVYTFIATPSKLVPSERFVFCWGYAYHTVRKCFVEMRPLWFKKSPLASTPVLSVRSKLDKEMSVKLMNDRPLETAGLEGKTEVIKQLAKHTTISQVEKDLLRVSAVDNTGALVGSFVDDKERVLACSQVVEGLVVHNLNGGGANNNSAATFDGDNVNNNSDTILDGDE